MKGLQAQVQQRGMSFKGPECCSKAPLLSVPATTIPLSWPFGTQAAARFTRRRKGTIHPSVKGSSQGTKQGVALRAGGHGRDHQIHNVAQRPAKHAL